jgi:hypothetical protein
MAEIVHGNIDATVQSIKSALDAYEAQHPGAQVSLYRQNAASVRMRVIDHSFEAMTKSRRHAHVWNFLTSHVPEDNLADVSLVLTVAPAELRNSFANFEFESQIVLKKTTEAQHITQRCAVCIKFFAQTQISHRRDLVQKTRNV